MRRRALLSAGVAFIGIAGAWRHAMHFTSACRKAMKMPMCELGRASVLPLTPAAAALPQAAVRFKQTMARLMRWWAR